MLDLLFVCGRIYYIEQYRIFKTKTYCIEEKQDGVWMQITCLMNTEEEAIDDLITFTYGEVPCSALDMFE